MSLKERILTIWRQNFNAFTHFSLRTILVDLSQLEPITLTENIIIGDDQNGQCLQNLDAATRTLTLSDEATVPTAFTVERINGPIIINAPASVFINDVLDSITLDTQFTSVYCRLYAPGRWKVEGSFIS